jgi:Do/DeqQ family serine protease
MFARALFALLILAGAGSALAQQPQRVAPTDRSQVVYSYAPIVKRVTPAVVNVYAQRTEQRQARNPLFDDPFFRQFFGQQPQTSRSLGSGVIVDANGLVVTNNHVIEGMTEVRVALPDRREIEAEIVLRDPRTDLAVLRLKNTKGLAALEFGDSDQLEVGDIVLAIGNPFAVGQTVTQGIVSALARTQVGITDYGFFIQTDAAINPGNSGGALVDMSGRLVGINTAIYSRSGGSVGIGFAVPVNMVKAIVRAAQGDGKLRRPWLGATLQNVTKEIADSLGMDRPSGALVSNVVAGGPSERAGLRRGDIITAIDNQIIDDMQGLGYRLATKTPGANATISVMRDNRKIDLAMKLEPAPETPPREELKVTGPSPFTGSTLVNFSPAIADEMQVHESVTEGVVIREIDDGSIAAQVGLQKGDVIIAINDAEMKRTRDVRQATQTRRNFWKITISRGGQVLNTILGG